MIILTYGPGWGEKNEILCPTRVVCSTIPRGGRRRRLDGRACSVGDDDVVVIVIFTTTFLFRGSGRRRRVCPPTERASKSPQCLRHRLCLFIWRRLEKRQRSPSGKHPSDPRPSGRVFTRVIFAWQPSRDVGVCTGMPVILPLWRRNSLPKSINHGRTATAQNECLVRTNV